MATEKPFKVIPVKEKLSGTGTLWEYQLFKNGYNKLPDKQKYGEVKGMFELDGGFTVFDIYFPALKIEVTNVFPDEIKEFIL